MFQQTSKLSHSAHQAQYHSSYPKSLQPAASKTLGSSPEMSAWLEQAQAWFTWYNGVMDGSIALSGGEKAPSQTEYSQMLEYWNWATGGQGGDSWNPIGSDDSAGPSGLGAAGPTDPFGGIAGPRGNLVYNTEKVRVGFTGRKETSDIWGNDVNIDVAPLSATVNSETTMDTRTQPPEQVIRVTVKDAATGTESVYIIHDYADAKIQINTPKESQLVGKTAGVSWSQFQESGSGPSEETDAVGTKNDKGEWEYVGKDPDAYLNFSPQNGSDETHLVWSNARILLGNADHAAVQKNADGSITVLVTHQDKSTDTYQIQKGYKLEIRGQSEYVGFAGGAEGAAMPADYADRIALNASAKSGDSPASGRNPKPDSVDAATATYNTQADVELHAFDDPAIEFYQIYAPGTVTIHAANYADKIEVKPVGKMPNATYIISVIDSKTGKTQDYAIYGNPEKIVIDGMDVELRDSAALDTTIEVTGKDADAQPNLLSSLMELTGKSEKQILSALKANFPTDSKGAALDTDEKVKTAIANGTLMPAKPNKALLQLLRALDDKFDAELSKASVYSHSVLGPAYKAATERLVTLLKAIYPDGHRISAARTETTDGYTTQWVDFNDIMFDGAKYSYTDESEGNTSNLKDWA